MSKGFFLSESYKFLISFYGNYMHSSFFGIGLLILIL